MSELPVAIMDGFIALGLGGANPVFPGVRPESHNGPCMTLILTGGIPVRSLPVRRPGLQVTSFHPTQEGAWTFAEEAFNSLKDRHNWELDGWLVEDINAIQEPFPLPRENRDYRVVFNLILSIRPTT
jgi:hypothetical protein